MNKMLIALPFCLMLAACNAADNQNLAQANRNGPGVLHSGYERPRMTLDEEGNGIMIIPPASPHPARCGYMGGLYRCYERHD